ncbi:MAG: alpha/beta hydrolase [Pseudomonadota bacterium]
MSADSTFDARPSPSRVLSIGSERISVHDSGGSGPAVVLVHGNSSSSRVWEPLLTGELGRKYRLIAPDLPGHGQSADAEQMVRSTVYSIPGYADVVRAVAGQMGVEKAVFVGWSLGGHAVLEAAASLPQAAGFMVFGTPPLPFPPTADFGGAFLKLGLGFVKDWSEDDARAWVADYMAPGVAAADFMLQDARRTDGHARASLAAGIGTVGYADELNIIATIGRPLAIVQGAHEQIVNPAYLGGLSPTIPTLWRGKVQVVEGAGHAVQWENPAQFGALLDAFVADCQRG